jgi:hypothetical protein
MKKAILALMIAVLATSSFASSRVDSMLSDDADSELQKIELTLNKISDNDAALNSVRDALKNESKKDNKRTTGKILIGVGAAGIIIGSVILKREPSFEQVFRAIALIGGGTIAGASGSAMILLNKSEVEELSAKISELIKENAENKKSLIKQVAKYCSVQPQNKLCY